MSNSDYYLGLEIGTKAVGWAVTDLNYKVIRKNKKALWGVRVFEEAALAQEKRMYRITRRALDRRRQRLDWLQDMFAEEIGSVDPSFFQRLKESKFLEEDKQGSVPLGRYTLFADKDYNDKDYHKQFPTIYHLRSALINQPGPFDIRLVYLALHHIMKHRGHSLYGDISLNTIDLDSGIKRLNQAMLQEYESALETDKMDELRGILISRDLNKTVRKKKLAALFNVTKDNRPVLGIIELLSGNKVSLDILFGEGTASEEISDVSLDDDPDIIKDKLIPLVSDRIELILAAKEIYDWALLEIMRNGEKYLSDAKVKSYAQHQEDLRKLKNAIQATGLKNLYYDIFCKSEKGLDNYTAYSGKGAKNYRCDYEAFRNYLSKILKKYRGEHAEMNEIQELLDSGVFLPKQHDPQNRVVPYQLHEAELAQILERAEAYLPFLKEKPNDGSGLTRSEQILAMFQFRIPYFVGPLDSRSERSWLVRKNEKIYPWNFDQIVDLETSRRNFVERMTAKCTYTRDDVLPKDSLLYTKFMVLNELNKMKINGNPISVGLKQKIYRELFMSGGKVSEAKLRSFLRLKKSDVISGFDGDVKATLAPWNHFSWLLPRPGGFEITEDIIRNICLFGTDKKFLNSWIKKTYGKILTAEEQKIALSFRAKGWGRLSRSFLTQIYHVDPDSGAACSIIELLWSTNQNLMELLGHKYTFKQAVIDYRKQTMDQQAMTLQTYLDECYASPAIKRGIRQMLAIVNEVVGIMQAPPRRIFIKTDQERQPVKKNAESRKEKLISLYRKCGETENPLFKQLTEEPKENLRKNRLYLFYSQLGKCMYSGELIDRAQLDCEYDIDHIYPKSKTRDDHLDNLVLVQCKLNRNKQDSYPIDSVIQEKMLSFWGELVQSGFISSEKYQRLSRNTPLTPEELAEFVNFQIVETRQSSKIAADLLHQQFGNKSEIICVKAQNVDDFCRSQKVVKNGLLLSGDIPAHMQMVQDPLFTRCKEINDYYHAKNAYLSIVVGNVYFVKFTKNPAVFIQENRRYSLNRMFDFDVERNGEIAWKAGEQESIATVRWMMQKNNILFTRKAAEVTGQLFDQLIVPKGHGQASIKSSDPRMSIEKYGGYNKLSGAYFALVEHTVKNKRVQSLEAILLIHKNSYEKNPELFCCEILGLVDPKILIRKVKTGTLLSVDNFRMHISGRSFNRIICKNANQLLLPIELQAYIKTIAKYVDRCKIAGEDLEITDYDDITSEKNHFLYHAFLEKLQDSIYRIKLSHVANVLLECTQKFDSLSVPDQCRILLQILNVFANNASSANLKLLNGKIGVGILMLSKNFTNYKDHRIFIIQQSVTGFFEKTFEIQFPN